MDADQELEALYLLSTDPVQCKTVVEKEVLDCLILVLEKSEGKNVLVALQIVEQLTKREDTKQNLSQFPDLCKPMQKIAQTGTDKDQQKLALDLYNKLWPALQTLESIKMLASNPDLCTTFVVDDGMLSSLVTMLNNKDQKILELTLETIYQMAEWTKHRPKLKYFQGLLEHIESLKSRSTCETITKLANDVYDRLWKNEEEQPVETQTTPTKHQPCHDCKEEALQDHSNVTKDVRPAPKPLKHLGKLKGKTIILQIKGLDHKDDVELCRNRILSVKGLISITFDLKKKRSIIRARPEMKPEILAEAIALTKTMSAEQVIKDDAGNETLLSFGGNHRGLNKENEEMPDYPEEDSPTIRGYKNMTSAGGAAPSTGGWGFVKTVGDFISNSFYW